MKQKEEQTSLPHKPRNTRRPPEDQEGSSGTKFPPGPATLSRLRSAAYATFMVLSAVLFLALVEGGLRLFHYGPDLALFTASEAGGSTRYVLNHEVKARYFAGIPFRASTSRDDFAMPKPSGTFRIFCLGGSTTVGFPYSYNAAFPTFLRDRLQRTFPGRKIEVINLGMTGTNSYTVLDLARELPAYNPDLLVVYDGHNEFYGALGVASQGLTGGSRVLSLAYLRLIHLRLFLLLRDLFDAFRSVVAGTREPAARDVTLERLSRSQHIPYGSPLYRKGEEIFATNLDDLRTLCRQNRIPLLLGSQVSNLRGQAPFVSDDSSSLSPLGRRRLAEHQRAGQAAWRRGQWEVSLQEYREAEAEDSLHAGTHFAIARSLDALGRRSEARVEYVKARDYDQLRFRASSDFNRRIASMEDTTTTGVVDMEGLYMLYSPDSLVGNELILEHLHPNSAGSFLMAKGYAAAMRERALLASPEEWARSDVIPDSTLWNDRPVTDLDERIALLRTTGLTSGWPFAEPSLSTPASFPRDSLQKIAERVVNGSWGAGDAHRAAAEYYEGQRDMFHAEQELRALISLDRSQAASSLRLARLYLEASRREDARHVLEESERAQPTAQAEALLEEIARPLGPAADSTSGGRSRALPSTR